MHIFICMTEVKTLLHWHTWNGLMPALGLLKFFKVRTVENKNGRFPNTIVNCRSDCSSLIKTSSVSQKKNSSRLFQFVWYCNTMKTFKTEWHLSWWVLVGSWRAGNLSLGSWRAHVSGWAGNRQLLAAVPNAWTVRTSRTELRREREPSGDTQESWKKKKANGGEAAWDAQWTHRDHLIHHVSLQKSIVCSPPLKATWIKILYRSNLQNRAGSLRDDYSCFHCCNVPQDMAVASRSPEDSNDLWDTCPLLFLRPQEWVSEPQTGSSNPPRTGLTQQLFQRRHRRSLG